MAKYLDFEGLTKYDTKIKALIDSKTGEVTQVEKTLLQTSWSNKELTLTVTGITATSYITISPKADSRKAFADAEIFASEQDTDEITFICEETPDDDIDIVVAFM